MKTISNIRFQPEDNHNQCIGKCSFLVDGDILIDNCWVYKSDGRNNAKYYLVYPTIGKLVTVKPLTNELKNMIDQDVSAYIEAQYGHLR